MNYEQELLHRLIDKYEKSKAFLTGVFTRKIALTAAQEDWIQRRMENMEEKRLFFAVLKDLKESGLIDYSWERFEQGKIWLIKSGWFPTRRQSGPAINGWAAGLPERKRRRFQN